MTQSFFVGVDGGATKCVVRLEDEAGNVLGRSTTGPANLNLSVKQTVEAIFLALNNLIQPLGISLQDKNYRWHTGMGLAGCEVMQDYQDFLSQAHPFETLIISSDAHVACLGAHRGADGAIIIIGTGSVGFQLSSGKMSKVGGWGFPHDDLGSGAALGLAAVRHTLQTRDGRVAASGLSQAIYRHFNEDMHALVTFANKANSTLFATLAPLLVQQAQAGDAMAIKIMQDAAAAIEQIAVALLSDNRLPCALVGGLAPFIQPYLNETLRARLVPCAMTPDEGAILLVKQSYAQT